jgi:hypothetical protein
MSDVLIQSTGGTADMSPRAVAQNTIQSLQSGVSLAQGIVALLGTLVGIVMWSQISISSLRDELREKTGEQHAQILLLQDHTQEHAADLVQIHRFEAILQDHLEAQARSTSDRLIRIETKIDAFMKGR